MSEWLPLLGVFWVLYLIDGLQIRRRRRFSFVSWFGDRKAMVNHGRGHGLGPLPGGWRAWADDLPWAFSPAGLSNEPVGSAGRPVEIPAEVVAWRWEDIRELQVQSGWLWINGQSFAPATPHFSPEELRQLAARCAALPPTAREVLLRGQLRLWLRPAHLRRRAMVWRHRTARLALLNTTVFAFIAALTVYLLFDVSQYLPGSMAQRYAHALPWMLGYAAVLHGLAVVLAWRVQRRLPPARRALRGPQLFSAALLPPQALHLRAILGEAWFPPMHPLAGAVALAAPTAVREFAFQTLADLRWPLPPARPRSALATEIAGWFRPELTAGVEAMLRAASLAPAGLLAPPAPDGSASCAYCPRCRDQFVAGHVTCPRGISLLPLK
jgi:hypothetical protein